jgi:hypothetical protein
MVVLLSLGEAIWSPRTYDYTYSIAPNGQEASFAALAAAPLFAAKIPVGLLSGYLLNTYCPEGGPNRGQIMWLIIGIVTLTSPILITLLEKVIREPVPPSARIILVVMIKTSAHEERRVAVAYAVCADRRSSYFSHARAPILLPGGRREGKCRCKRARTVELTCQLGRSPVDGGRWPPTALIAQQRRRSM